MQTDSSAQVFGPAYLDRVLRTTGPLRPVGERALDLSAEGRLPANQGGSGAALELVDPEGGRLVIDAPAGWPGPWGEVALGRAIRPDARAPWRFEASGASWHDDLGGMGAGFAAALGGRLVCALGPANDPVSVEIRRLLSRNGVAADPIVVPDQAADWTLLLTSGGHGDKLPVGFRGCHARLEVSEVVARVRPSDLRVVTALPNRLAGPILRAPGAGLRVFAPALRNMVDREAPVSAFAESIDVLCCNRAEWEALEGRERVGRLIPVLSVTDGASGSHLRLRTARGQSTEVRVRPYPRSHPPRDTNRAGEAYASELLRSLSDAGWEPGGELSRAALVACAARASAAAALTLDLDRFGFPRTVAIAEALSRGEVLPPRGQG